MISTVESTVAEIYADHRDPTGAVWSPALWSALETGGFTLLGVPESRGGSGGDLGDAATVIRQAGRFAAPIPVVESTLLAAWLLARACLEVPHGPMSVAFADAALPSGAFTLRDVPWGGIAERVVIVSGTSVFCVSDRPERVIERTRMSPEPIAELSYAADALGAPLPLPDGTAAELRLRGALGAALLISGALERLLELAVDHARSREQFGRPIARFQAVQHNLARLAEEVEAARVACAAAVAAVSAGPGEFQVRVAKIRAGEAAGTAAALAHQVHGALGFTDEFPLAALTRRLYAWRDRYGSESFHADALGESIVAAGADALWPAMTPPAVS
ncbi:acyl-CoA dehydrogenase family protein [Actinophytocola sp.]|uniref:acyl-CoA dehydrogenase family protein n=1 Tax=Actinophytocola sp. TaxID=1872138 RepID=UPI003D6AC668